jgi:hypothetical protein
LHWFLPQAWKFFKGKIMIGTSINSNQKDRSRVITVLGILLLLGGIAVGFLAPLEMYCFYLFSAGGRFAYDGFGFGSFMFGNIAAQIVGYYLLAAVLIPIGYGHIKLLCWARTLTITLAWTWLVIGAPIVLLVAFILLGSKELALPAALAAFAFLAMSYLVLPGLVIRFYGGANVSRAFEAKDPKIHGIGEIPQPLLVLAALFVFFTVMMHLLILFNGIYPAFGVFLYGLPGIVMIDFTIVCLLCLTWGVLRRRSWAWWGATILWGLFTISLITTWLNTGYPQMLSGLAFPARELDMLDGIPLQGFHLAFLTGVPCFITWILAVSSKRFFH